MPLYFAIRFNSFSDRFSIVIHKNKQIFFKYESALKIALRKNNDVVRDKYGLKYILLPKYANILLDYLFWLVLGWLHLRWLLLEWLLLNCCKLYKVKTAIIKLYSKTPLGDTGCLSNFLGYFSLPLAFLPGFSDL